MGTKFFRNMGTLIIIIIIITSFNNFTKLKSESKFDDFFSEKINENVTTEYCTKHLIFCLF